MSCAVSLRVFGRRCCARYLVHGSHIWRLDAQDKEKRFQSDRVVIVHVRVFAWVGQE
jgi:hypothetical protein